MIGIYDFSYGPYALGDALTWTMNVNVRAAEAGADAVDEYLVMDPAGPRVATSRSSPSTITSASSTICFRHFFAVRCCGR